MINKDERRIIFLEPVFKQYIWGGNKLKTYFDYDIPSDSTAECWGISAHENGPSIVSEGSYKGMTLSDLYSSHPELFGIAVDASQAANKTSKDADKAPSAFPLLVKILDAKSASSIQVHPDDKYANEHENGASGKTECWYILDCDDGAELIIGHNAGTKAELESMIKNNKWDDLLKKVPIKKNDFILINPGTIHSFNGGVLIFETQQSSDITYRIYDYGRLENGKPRTLHTNQALDVISVPDNADSTIKNYSNINQNELTEMASCKYFSTWRLNVNDSYTLKQDEPFMNVSVIGGEGNVNGHPICKGSHFILPYGIKDVKFTGNMELVISAPKY